MREALGVGKGRSVVAGALAAVTGLLVSMPGCTETDLSRAPSQVESPLGSQSFSTSTASDDSEPRLLALTSYLRHRHSFEAARLVAVDPETFQPVEGEELRLGDSVTTDLADPTGNLLAFGGINYGEVLIVDPTELAIVKRVKVARRGPSAPEVHILSWPRSDRILGYSQQFDAHSLLPGRAFVADPDRQELVASVPLHGSVLAAIPTKQGAAFLVSPARTVGTARLVLMGSEAQIRDVPLSEVTAGYVDPGNLGDSLGRWPTLVSVGNMAYVVSESEPVAAVNLRSTDVSYHSIKGLMGKHLPASTYPATGSAGSLESHSRDTSIISGSKVLVSGHEGIPIREGPRYATSNEWPKPSISIKEGSFTTLKV